MSTPFGQASVPPPPLHEEFFENLGSFKRFKNRTFEPLRNIDLLLDSIMGKRVVEDGVKSAYVTCCDHF